MSLYGFGKAVCKSFFALFYKPVVIGKENIPKDGGVILCCNHISNFDPPLLGTYIDRKVHYMAKAELFKLPLLKSIFASLGAFPVKRGFADKQALRTGIQLLKRENVLGIFPEGFRNKTGQLGKGFAGVGFFALKTEATVIPCAIIGSYRPFNKVKVVYGKPIDMTSYREEKKSSEEVTAIIMDAIQQLLNQHK